MIRLGLALALLAAAGCPTRMYYARCGTEAPVDLRSDPAHCGGCRRCCPDGTTCVGGECRCPEGDAGCEPRAFGCGADDARPEPPDP